MRIVRMFADLLLCINDKNHSALHSLYEIQVTCYVTGNLSICKELIMVNVASLPIRMLIKGLLVKDFNSSNTTLSWVWSWKFEIFNLKSMVKDLYSKVEITRSNV